MLYNIGDILVCKKQINTTCLVMTNSDFDIKPGDRYMVIDKDSYPDENACHYYILTAEKDRNITLTAWNDKAHMIVDENFEKVDSGMTPDIAKLRKDIKEHLRSCVPEGYVNKVMSSMGDDIMIDMLWRPSYRETGNITYYDIVLRQIHVMYGANPYPDSIAIAVVYCLTPYRRVILWYGVIFCDKSYLG